MKISLKNFSIILLCSFIAGAIKSAYAASHTPTPKCERLLSAADFQNILGQSVEKFDFNQNREGACNYQIMLRENGHENSFLQKLGFSAHLQSSPAEWQRVKTSLKANGKIRTLTGIGAEAIVGAGPLLFLSSNQKYIGAVGYLEMGILTKHSVRSPVDQENVQIEIAKAIDKHLK